MKIRKITVVYFSATYTTRKTVMALAESFGCEVTETDVTDSMPEPMTIAAGDGKIYEKHARSLLISAKKSNILFLLAA